MRTTLKFQGNYFVWTIILFVIEILIAKYLHDRVIRPYVGDLLVAILVYCFVKSFLDAPVIKTSLAVLAFCYMIETLQYFQILDKTGLGKFAIARVVLGTSFEWTDMLAYTLGIAVVIVFEKYRFRVFSI